MYFSFLPLYSMQAWGRFYGPHPFGYWYPVPRGALGYAIYQRRHTPHGIITIKERYYYSSNPHHPYCIKGQQSFASAVHAWQDLTDEEKEIYNHYRYPGQMSGYNRFLHYYLRELPY